MAGFVLLEQGWGWGGQGVQGHLCAVPPATCPPCWGQSWLLLLPAGAATRKEAPPNSQDALEKFLLALCADLLITGANFFTSSG